MRIGIDARLWNETGVGRYVRNLVTNLTEIDKKNEYVLFASFSNADKIKQVIKSSKFKIVTTNIHWHSIEEQVQFPKLLNKENLDLVHFPYFSVPIFYKKPFVVTIHDLIVNNFSTGRASTLPLPLYMIKRFGYHKVLQSAIKNARKIIVPSKSVKENLLAEYPTIDLTKVEVTYEGGFATNSKIKIQNSKLIEEKYILRVGNYYPHKNVEGLINAFRELVYENPENQNLKLVLVGKRDYFYDRIKKEIEKLNLSSNVLFKDNVDDDELVSLYKNAVATIIPSFAEGFSLTAVEAMSVGSVVIASDIPVHREICNSAAIYCNPNDTNDIKQKIDFALSLSPSSRDEMIKEGIKQSEKFSWEKMARETLKIYQTSA